MEKEHRISDLSKDGTLKKKTNDRFKFKFIRKAGNARCIYKFK